MDWDEEDSDGWEDVGVGTDVGVERPVETPEEMLTRLRAVAAVAAAAAAAPEDEKGDVEVSSKVRRRKRRLAGSIAVHKMFLLCGVAEVVRLSRICDDVDAQAGVVSLVPPELHCLAPESSNFERIPTVRRLGQLFRWFQSHVVLSRDGVVGVDPKVVLMGWNGRMVRVCDGNAASVLFVTLARGLGLVCRLVGIVDAPTPRVDGGPRADQSEQMGRESHASRRLSSREEFRREPELSRLAAGTRFVGQVYCVEEEEEERDYVFEEGSTTTTTPQKSERFEEESTTTTTTPQKSEPGILKEGSTSSKKRKRKERKKGRWIVCDPSRRIFDNVPALQFLRKASDPPCYCVAACSIRKGAHRSVLATMSDVTSTFTPRGAEVLGHRKRAETTTFFPSLVHSLDTNLRHIAGLPPKPPKSSSSSKPKTLVTVLDDDSDSDDTSSKQSSSKHATIMPRSKAGFRTSVDYCLPSQLGVYQTIRPGIEPVSMYKGEPVYPRSAIAPLRSALRWYRGHGRNVRKDQIDHPHKTKTSTSSSDPTSKTTHQLYGEWQTDPVDPGELSADGRTIPTNEHGYCELWTPAFLPRNTAHVDDKFASEFAAKLQIPYARALIGFDKRAGKWIPRTAGVVIPAIHESTLREACELKQKEKLAKEAQAKYNRVLSRWDILARGLLRHQLAQSRFQQVYQTVPTNPTTGLDIKGDFEEF